MTERGEVVYTTIYEPDRTHALTVLAFLLVDERAFTSSDDPEDLEAVRDMLDHAKREALLDWYRSRGREA